MEPLLQLIPHPSERKAVSPAAWWRQLPLKPKLKCTFITLTGLFAASVSVSAGPASSGYVGVLLGGAGTLLSAAFGISIYRAIIIPLDRILGEMGRFSEGDLTTTATVMEAHRLVRLEASLASCRAKVCELIAQIKVASDLVDANVTGLARDNADLARRTAAQAASLMRTAAAMEQFAAAVHANASNAGKAHALVGEACGKAASGSDAVARVVATMSSIRQSGNRIVDIVGMIDAIAFQTNILALNAAVEAARAGEEGRGFAVVAAEVRALAQRSAGAAREIKSLIEASASEVEVGSRLAAESGNMMNDILRAIEGVAETVDEIASACREQTAGIDEVNRTVEQIDGMTRKNAALVDGAADAANAMAQQVKRLGVLVRAFRLER